MKIQVGHSRDFDFVKELYEPIKKAIFFTDHEFIFPHDWKEIDSKETLKNIDIFIADVSYPSIWLGMELWFASLYGKKIICVYRNWNNISSALTHVSDILLPYKNSAEMVEKLQKILN